MRENRASELERYFRSLQNQVLALATDESTLTVVEQLSRAWASIPIARSTDALRTYYAANSAPEHWFPADPRTQSLQTAFLANSPHPEGAKDLLLDAQGTGAYGKVHARFHPTLHRYKTAFGFYDLFLIDPDGRVLYSVMKEIDLGVNLAEEPYKQTPLATVYRRALAEAPEQGIVMEDYTPYAPSHMAPAAFLATPLFRAGKKEGVLVAQVAIDEVNDVMDGGRRWSEQGLGRTGQVYIVGPDRTLRSDLRESIERPEEYPQKLRVAGISPDFIERVRANRTSVLSFPIDLTVAGPATELGRNPFGVEVLRSQAPLHIGDLHWSIIAEIAKDEALVPVNAMRQQVTTLGFGVAIVCFLAAGWLGASVTGPVLELAAAARRLGSGERGLRLKPASADEVGQLADDFNRMSDDLERTTVSRDEFQVLAGRLITAQEDERKRVARELHDDFTQRLAAAAIETGRLEQDTSDPDVRASLAHLKDQVARISTDVHTLSRGLHPSMLDDLGLAAAIEQECRASFERGGPIVELHIGSNVDGISKQARLALYRITQEALRNIQRHSGAHEAELWLDAAEGNVHLRIQDHGEGFDRTQPGWQPGLGLASMEERARLLGGTMRVEALPGRGTTIDVSLPSGPTA